MSPLLQKIMIALGRRGDQVPIDETLGAAYRALGRYQDLYPNVFNPAAEILLAEIEGGATTIQEVPRRLGHLTQMLDRLHRQEELTAWAQDDDVVVVA